jgi:hypothetical protein
MPGSEQGGIAVPLQATAAVCHDDLGSIVSDGVQALSTTTSGSMVSDRTQGTPLQSCPAGMAPWFVQLPSHGSGAEKNVCAAPGPSPGQISEFATNVVGSSHDPEGA